MDNRELLNNHSLQTTQDSRKLKGQRMILKKVDHVAIEKIEKELGPKYNRFRQRSRTPVAAAEGRGVSRNSSRGNSLSVRLKNKFATKKNSVNQTLTI